MRGGVMIARPEIIKVWVIYIQAGTPGGGGTPIHYLYGYVPPNGVVILKFLI